jgi:hypothetical protein
MRAILPHIKSWSRIYGMHPEPGDSSFLIADMELYGARPDLCTTWQEHISGGRPQILWPHEETELIVRHRVAQRLHIAVQLRTELLK